MSQPLLSQASTTADADASRWVDPALARQARALAAQGSVLLVNDGILPLAPGTSVAVFGRTALDWIPVGYGSGGDVNPPYQSTLAGALADESDLHVDADLAALYADFSARHPAAPGKEWGAWPTHYPEMPVSGDVIEAAAARNDLAIVVIGRAAGEDRDAQLAPGSYYLTPEETSLLERVTAAFARTLVIVNTGNLIDLSWAERYPISGLLIAWAGGMEAGNAVADILTGRAEPGGRLTATVAREYRDYPSGPTFGEAEVSEYREDIFVGYRYFETFAQGAVQYPFGYGLGYSTRVIECREFEADSLTATLAATVTNTGDLPTSEVVQVYVEAPDGALSRPTRHLAAFARTGTLAPGESAEVRLAVDLADCAAYDDAGVTGRRSAFVLEPGTYRVHVGPDARSAREAGRLEVATLEVVRQCEEAASVPAGAGFERMIRGRASDGTPRVATEPVPLETRDLAGRILDRLPEEVTAEDGAAPTWDAVRAGEGSLEEFVASLSDTELADLTYGDTTMDSPLGVAGNAGALGGVSEALRARGIEPAITTDGPSGLRVAAFASLLPCGTGLASTWNLPAVRDLSAIHAEEMIAKGSDILLSPGMNIQRDPLCGRNFEYFSEDPLLTGRMGAAIVGGVQSRGVAACPKHFAANNQEFNRIHVDARVSERALREIYLRGFEIVVREAAPLTLMTSYNKINGVWGHYHYDLVTTILRGEWGYTGLVVTDWWMQMASDPHFPALRDSAYRVRAQVDVLMPGSNAHGGDVRDTGVIDSLGSSGGLTRAEVQRSAANVLTFLLRADLHGHALADGQRREGRAG